MDIGMIWTFVLLFVAGLSLAFFMMANRSSSAVMGTSAWVAGLILVSTLPFFVAMLTLVEMSWLFYLIIAGTIIASTGFIFWTISGAE